MGDAPPPSSIAPDRDFEPGQMIGDRYRIISFLGKGGMGVVYHAEDVTLGQSVALKFLPAHFQSDASRLNRLKAEVRLARQVSHPNVCRVYDLAQIEGRWCLSMERIDGEDLSVLLSRIGRLPGEKAIELSRQICAGLAAAHELGVIHRDLKPANIMIDGRGRARITDFGVAGFADDLKETADIRAGTPAYMAPEQFAGKEVTKRSDIYSLGLVLYELFTGKRAHNAKRPQDLSGLHESTPSTRPSEHVVDIDPAVERVIMRCLEPVPSDRPPSAFAVLAGMPGGDPLAAAIEAGETPSPELVAASGGRAPWHPAISAALALVTLACVGAIAILGNTTTAVGRVNAMTSAVILENEANALLEELGHPTDHPFSAIGLGLFEPWRDTEGDLATARPSWKDEGFETPFWFRQSPARYNLTAVSAGLLQVGADTPTMQIPGESRVAMQPDGQLRELVVIPAAGPSEPTAPAIAETEAVSLIFERAGLDLRDFRETFDNAPPPIFCDEVRTWRREPTDQPALEDLVRIGWFQGRVHLVEVLPRAPQEEEGVSVISRVDFSGQVVSTTIFFITPLIAFWHLRLGKCDRRTAARLALFIAVAETTAWLLLASRSEWLSDPAWRLVGRVAPLVVVLWTTYLALEPFVRRQCPRILVSWKRLFDGKFFDPLVGQALFVGIVIAAVSTLMLHLIIVLLDRPPLGAMEFSGISRSLRPDSFGSALAALIETIMKGPLVACIWGIFFGIAHVFFRKLVITAIVATILFGITSPAAASVPPYGMLLMVPASALATYATIRLGLVVIVGVAFTFSTLLVRPLYTDFNGSFGLAAALAIAFMITIVAWAAWAASGSHPIVMRARKPGAMTR